MKRNERWNESTLCYRPMYAVTDADVEILLGVLERAGVPRWYVDRRDLELPTDQIGRKYGVHPDLLAGALGGVLL